MLLVAEPFAGALPIAVVDPESFADAVPVGVEGTPEPVAIALPGAVADAVPVAPAPAFESGFPDTS